MNAKPPPPDNPVRTHLLRPEEPLESYALSSYRHYLNAPGKRLGWLRTDRLLGEWGISHNCSLFAASPIAPHL